MSREPLSHPVVPVRTYLLILGALLLLTAITTAVALWNLGSLNDVVAMGIAVLKAALVVLYFMHAKDSPPLTKLVIAAALLWLLILFALTLGDYATRG